MKTQKLPRTAATPELPARLDVAREGTVKLTLILKRLEARPCVSRQREKVIKALRWVLEGRAALRATQLGLAGITAREIEAASLGSARA